MRMISFVRSVRWCVVIFYIVEANKNSSFVEIVWPKIQKFRQIRVFSLYSYSFIRKRLSNENICDLWIVLGDNQQSTFNIQHSTTTQPFQIHFHSIPAPNPIYEGICCIFLWSGFSSGSSQLLELKYFLTGRMCEIVECEFLSFLYFKRSDCVNFWKEICGCEFCSLIIEDKGE